MKIRLREDPREWRKSVWLTALGLLLLSSVLWWRRILPGAGWLAMAGTLVLVCVAALIQPRWFKGYYRFSMRAGVWLSHLVARVVLVLIFAFIVTPLGLLLRLAGKDLLCLRRGRTQSYWSDVRESGPLDRLF